MRKLLLLALLLYDIIAIATRANNFDYDEMEGAKRHSLIDDRRNWRKKVLLNPAEMDHKDFDGRRRHDYENQKYFEDQDPKLYGGLANREREPDPGNYKKRYEDVDKVPGAKSAELGHPAPYLDDKKMSVGMNCDRQHERFESCFAGCAAISCDNPRERLRPCYPFCEPGCICVPPYVRDDRTHKCVLPDECSKGLKGIPDLGDDT